MAELESKPETTLLQVGEVIKPMVSEDSVREIIRKDYGLEVIKVKELNSYDDRNYHVTVEPTHTNPHIKALHPHGYVLKILNTMDSKRQPYIEAMQALILHVGEQGITTAQPIPSVTGKLMILNHIPVDSAENNGNDSRAKTKAHVVRLFTFVPGKILFEVSYTPRLCYSVGKYAGKLDRILQTFRHSFYDTHSSIWSLGSLPKLREFVYAVPIKSDREMVNDILTRFESEVIPKYNKFQKGMIHGDYNEQNIIVRLNEQSKEQDEIGKEEYEVCGVIDFGDATDSYLVFEVAIAMCYIMIESKAIHAFDAAGHLLAGYISEVPLNETEMDALKICIAGRFCHSLVLGAYNISLDPNNDYVTTTSKRGWPCLRDLWKTSSDQLRSQWNNIISTYANNSV